ncbi:MAG: trehalose-phosphatase [Ilumatobacter sp.]|uniref:trehalose-phosphatase n=1 Tax=Ilumatobacter sp. TaxID=1967498 RepID=UPI002616066F|nr:trehalose-phosphatase [Ilumatobacter sp.]MDJ0770873.1 trehalose-phosphatase [Ilumatobacter sp.]
MDDTSGAMAPIQDLPSALDHYEAIEQRLGDKRLAVFLDYDGTLTPIVARPELAVLSDHMREVVTDLAGLCTVGIISGRDRHDVEQLVGIDSLVYAGSHGFDIGGPDGLAVQHDHGTSFLPVMQTLADHVEARLGDVEGSLVERKKYSIAVHYRLVADDEVAVVEAAVDETLAEPEFANIRKTLGKKVFDLQPAIEWHKGKAVEWVMHALDLDHDDVLPMFFGDDLTDEDAFAALAANGLGVVVVSDSARPSGADYGVPEVPDVGLLLERLAATLRSR